MHFWIARNYSRGTRGDNSYVVTLEKPECMASRETGEVRFRQNLRWSTYVIASKADRFEARFPQLKLKPGEGPYPLAISFAEFPKTQTIFAGVEASSLAEATGHKENSKKGGEEEQDPSS